MPKITNHKLRVDTMKPPRTVCIEATLLTEFGNLVESYRRLKIHHKINLGLCLFLFLMSAMFFSRLGFAAALATLFVIGATLLYLTVQQQEMIKILQRISYNISVKSLSQLDSSDPHTDGKEAYNED